jgi:hypothetical protein
VQYVPYVYRSKTKTHVVKSPSPCIIVCLALELELYPDQINMRIICCLALEEKSAN